MRRILLDTNALIWTVVQSSRLTPQWRDALVDPDNDVWFSAVSVAEIALKSSLGKLSMPPGYVAAARESGYAELPLTADHAQVLDTLPWHHRDPFDRLIIAQAMSENLDVMTSDAVFSEYPVALV